MFNFPILNVQFLTFKTFTFYFSSLNSMFFILLPNNVQSITFCQSFIDLLDLFISCFSNSLFHTLLKNNKMFSPQKETSKKKCLSTINFRPIFYFELKKSLKFKSPNIFSNFLFHFFSFLITLKVIFNLTRLTLGSFGMLCLQWAFVG
jgi:hypothetical protein